MSQKALTFAELEALFQGQFDWVARMLCGAPIEPALGKMGRHVTDPVTGKPKSFRLDRNFPSNGKWYRSGPQQNHGVFNLVEYVTGLSKREIWSLANDLARNNGLAPITMTPADRRKAAEAAKKAQEEKERLEWAQNAERIRKVAKGAISIRDARAWPALRYFAERGLTLHSEVVPGQLDLPQAVGFHPKLRSYTQDEDGGLKLEGEFPTILCKVTNGKGEIVTLHRIYLQKDGSGKAPVAEPKKAMPPRQKWGGASVKMYPPTNNGVLAVAEGVETALAVREGTGLPVWATVHASGMSLLEVPQGIRVVAIFADKDRSGTGEQAAQALQRRLESMGIKSVILMPPMDIPEGVKGVDWLDVLNTLGPRAFVSATKEVLALTGRAEQEREEQQQVAVKSFSEMREALQAQIRAAAANG